MVARSRRYSTADNVDLGDFVAQRLKTIRQLKGLSQKELILAADLKVTQQIFSKYENGMVRIPSTTLYILAKALQVSLESFFPAALPAVTSKRTQQDILEKTLTSSLTKLKKIENTSTEEIKVLETILKRMHQKA